jgi:hypothetical protein
MYHQVNHRIFVNFFEFTEEFILCVGFEHNSDALAAAEIEQKMAEFELEPIFDNEQQDVDNDQ